jgi:predicted aspartyl protease
MRQSFIGAIGSGASIRFHHIQAYTWTAAIVALLTGCVEAASILTEAGTSKLLFRGAPLQKYQSGWFPDTILHGPSASESEPSSLTVYVEEYWMAIADLDFGALRTLARSEPEIGFAEGLSSLAAGNQIRAESAFTKGRQVADVNVAVASQIMLATTLLSERKWIMLRDLTASVSLEVAGRANTIELERWGRAFANADQQETTLPELPVSLPLRVTSLGTPTVRVRINGKEYEFWIDTGSGITVLSSDVASDAKVADLSPDTLRVRTFAGTVPVTPAVVKRLEIGSIVFINTPAVVIEASLMQLRAPGEGASRPAVHVDGIIGWDTIRQLDVVMDYQSRRITMSRPDNLGTRGTASQNLKWVGKPLVEVRTKLGRVLHFIIDTGAQASFLNASVLEKAGITPRNSDSRIFGIASTGASTDRIVPTLTLDVARRPLRLQSVIVYGPIFYGIINCDGILGSDIARFGSIRIDATNGLFSVGD